MKKYIICNIFIFLLLFCSFGCKTKSKVETNHEEKIYSNENVSEKLSISERLDPILNFFYGNENPSELQLERSALTASIILEYINEEGGLSDNLIHSIPNEEYNHFSPDNLFHLHTWDIPYAKRPSNYRHNTIIFIKIIQFKTENEEEIFISMNDIINMLDILNIDFLRDFSQYAQRSSYYYRAMKFKDMYLFEIFFRYNGNDVNYDEYIGDAVIAVKYEDGKFVPQKIFNNEKYLIFFWSGARPDYYVLGGEKINIEKEIILVTVYKVVGKGNYEDDPDIIDYKNIELKYNGSEFIGDYKKIYELSKKSGPPDFNININIPSNKNNN
jgi:hypothetical protein